MKLGIREFIKTKIGSEEDVFLITLIFLAFAIGVYIRWQFTSHTVYPLNDGGLFYQMTEDIMSNGFKLPEFTTYNKSDIPLAYPPFGFYLAAVSHKLFQIPLLKVFKWLPSVISVLTLIAFYVFAKGLLNNSLKAAIALLLFSMVPRSFEWFLMGGGITRAPGFLFVILAMTSIWRLYSGNATLLEIIKAIGFSSLTVLSHPETALFLIFAVLLFFSYHKPNKVNFISSLWIGFGVAVVTSPWWITVLLHHGMNPFLGASGTGHVMWFSVKNLVTLNFGFENNYFLSVLSVFAIIGVFANDSKLSRYLAFMLIGGYILFPRSSVNLLTIVISILATFGLEKVLQGLNESKMQVENQDHSTVNIFRNVRSKAFFIFMLIYMFLGAVTYKYTFDKNKLGLNSEYLKAIEWIKENTLENDKIMLYPIESDNRFWWNDYLAEWIPALTNRRSVTTVQGYEWLPNSFYEKVNNYIILRSCKDIGPVCVEAWEENNQVEIDYLIMVEIRNTPYLARSFWKDKRYQIEYDQEDLVIFSKSYNDK